MKSMIWLAVIPALLLGGCSSTKPKPEPTPAAATTGAGTGTAPPPSTVTGRTGANGISYDQYGRPMPRVIYFDYDRSELRADQRTLADAHAKYLVDNPNAKARLEGHADERGSREYNLALGERRAKSVQQYMSIQGAKSASQMETFSYGEEKPLSLGHNEQAWGQNRRVEVVYP